MAPTRRAFLGTIIGVPLASVLIGEGCVVPGGGEDPRQYLPAKTDEDVVELPTNAGETELITPFRFGQQVFSLVNKQLRGRRMRVVGRGLYVHGAKVGYVWGSGVFTKHVYALLPDLKMGPKGKLIRDRLLIEGAADKLAQKIVSENLHYSGPLELPGGVASAHNYVNRRLMMRFVTVFDIRENQIVGRFGVLGT